LKWPFLQWRHDWRQPGTLRADALAGLTGAIVVLPQGVAFATLAGLPPQHGLWAAMLPCIVAALFGSSRLMVTGPANAISLSTLALLAPLATPFTARYAELAVTLAFLVGMMQVLLGLARVGRLMDHVPQAVVVGFTAGAALLIVNAQLGVLLGLSLPGGGVLSNLQAAWAQLGQAQPGAWIVSALTCDPDPANTTCVIDSDCPTNYVCFQNTCVTDPNGIACASNADCPQAPQAYICENNMCVEIGRAHV
jgi:SulP family sulfate permease